MQAIVERFLAVRRLTDRPATVLHVDLAVRQFVAWLVEADPRLETFAQVTREHVLAYAETLQAMCNPRTGRPMQRSPSGGEPSRGSQDPRRFDVLLASDPAGDPRCPAA
jgi:hypothetical protein